MYPHVGLAWKGTSPWKGNFCQAQKSSQGLTTNKTVRKFCDKSIFTWEGISYIIKYFISNTNVVILVLENSSVIILSPRPLLSLWDIKNPWQLWVRTEQSWPISHAHKVTSKNARVVKWNSYIATQK